MVWLRVERVTFAAIQHTVAVPVPLQISRFQVWGSNPRQDHFFAFFLLATFCNSQSTENIFLSNFIDWLIWVVISSHITKSCFDWDSNPIPGNVELAVELELPWLDTQSNHVVEETQGKRPMIAYCFTQCSNGCSLSSLLFPRQENHDQRRTKCFFYAIVFYLNSWGFFFFFSSGGVLSSPTSQIMTVKFTVRRNCQETIKFKLFHTAQKRRFLLKKEKKNSEKFFFSKKGNFFPLKKFFFWSIFLLVWQDFPGQLFVMSWTDWTD